jgi:hypothetical protein
MRFLILTLALFLAFSLSACRDTGGVAFSVGAPPPSLFEGVYDIPCADVRQQVRDKMKQDPSLGLSKETTENDLVSYETPEHWNGNLSWKATVRVRCTGEKSSQISAKVWAQKRAQGGWNQVTDTTKMQREILDKVTPKP